MSLVPEKEQLPPQRKVAGAQITQQWLVIIIIIGIWNESSLDPPHDS